MLLYTIHSLLFNLPPSSHMDFVKATAFLFARLSGLKISREDRADEVVRPMLQDVHVPPFTPNSDKVSYTLLTLCSFSHCVV